MFELERNLLTRTKLGFYQPYQLLIYALQSPFYTTSSTRVFLSLLRHHLMYPFCLLHHYSVIRMKMNRYSYLTKRTLQGCLLRTGQCLITIFIDEPTAIIQKRMHTSGVISWYYIRSTLAIPQVVCTCTKCRLYSFRLSNIADVTNVTC